jgi:hypothetical protein
MESTKVLENADLVTFAEDAGKGTPQETVHSIGYSLSDTKARLTEEALRAL